MKKIISGNLFISFVFALIIVGLPANADPKSKKKPAAKSSSITETVVATVGNESITYSEMERAYKKNMNRKDVNFFDIPKDSIVDFLNLYANYRLKVCDATSRGFDKDSTVLGDINQNRRVLAESFFYEKKLIESRVNQMLKLRETEIQFAFMLFKFPGIPGGDTLNTYRKAKACLDLVKGGKKFETVAADSSEDKETAVKGGLVADYVTAGKIQRNIERALYSIKAGEVYPELVKFRDGYLILKLVHAEPRLKAKVRHILLSEGLEKDSLKIFKKADSLISLLKKGTDFAKLAEENSDDPSSAVKGGDIGAWYSRSSGMDGKGTKLLPAFEEAIFKLKDGEFSGKVLTDYGVHIIKREASQKFDEAADQDELRKLYKRVYYEGDKREFLDSLAKAFGFQIDYQVVKSFLSFVDTNKTNLDTAWSRKIPDDLKEKNLFKFNGKYNTVSSFITSLSKKQEFRGTSTNFDGITKAISKIVDPETFDLATKNLEKEYAEFASLMKEFRDGILLFKVEALEVWDKLKFDSTLARSFYDSTKSKYNTLPAYEFSEIYVMNDSLAKDIYKKAKGGENFEVLAENFTQRASYRERKGLWGRFTTKENELVRILNDKKAKAGTILEPIPYEKGFSILKANKFEPVRMKTFEESIPDFAPEFQEILQKNLIDKWLNKVREKYPVKIDNAALENVLNELKKSSNKKTN